MQNNIHEELIFVGFTNGYQILYASEDNGEGLIYSDPESDCHIPVYMLKTHTHRLESTSNFSVKLDDIKSNWKKKRKV